MLSQWRRQSMRKDKATPSPSSEQAARRMRSVRRRDTAAELAVRKATHRLGLRYRVDVAPIRGIRSRADLVFFPARVAVFIDGCFWHGCPLHGTAPKSNAAWWREKIAANKERDAITDIRLRDMGWCVVRAWEHEAPELVAMRIQREVSQR